VSPTAVGESAELPNVLKLLLSLVDRLLIDVTPNAAKDLPFHNLDNAQLHLGNPQGARCEVVSRIVFALSAGRLRPPLCAVPRKGVCWPPGGCAFASIGRIQFSVRHVVSLDWLMPSCYPRD
jgi:hypothetical protein